MEKEEIFRITDSSDIKKSIYVKGRIIIFAMAILAAVLQGNYVTSVACGAERQIQMTVVLLAGIVLISLWTARSLGGKMTDEGTLFYIIFFGTLMRTAFVLFNDIRTLQNDGGTFTGFGTPNINNGHIGYIEYIYKFFHLPDMDPYEYFGYYHPPLHHIIEALWMTLQRFIGVPEELAFENLQIPTLIYSSLCMLVMLHILEESGISKKYIKAGLLLFAFHPRMMVLAGSVNNDILALLLLLVTIWRMLAWIGDKSYRNIILLALSLGFGMISKLNTAICAFSIAVIFLVELIRVIKEKNLVNLKRTVLEYVVFGLICIPIGLSYIVRNLVLFGEKPGIPSPAIIPSQSVMYTGDYSVWSIIGIPALSELRLEFPFHPLSAKAIHNTWVILFQTGLFAEAYPTTIGDFLLSFAQVAYVASIILAVLTTIIFICGYTKKYVGEVKEKYSKSSDATLFLLSTYVFMLLSFCLYVFKYPYTCSSDFRYMTASLVFTSIGFVLSQKSGRALRYILNTAMAVTLICSLIVYMFWDI